MSPSHHDPTTMDAEERPTSTAALVAALIQLYATSPKAVRANVHDYPASIYANDDESSTSTAYRDRKITSWKLTEHMLLDAKNSFPTFARGLFTEEMEDDDELPAGIERDYKSRDRIVARGYDKFFSPGEVAWTKVSHL